MKAIIEGVENIGLATCGAAWLGVVSSIISCDSPTWNSGFILLFSCSAGAEEKQIPRCARDGIVRRASRFHFHNHLQFHGHTEGEFVDSYGCAGVLAFVAE